MLALLTTATSATTKAGSHRFEYARTSVFLTRSACLSSVLVRVYWRAHGVRISLAMCTLVCASLLSRVYPQSAVDPATGSTYYYDNTGATQWEPPV